MSFTRPRPRAVIKLGHIPAARQPSDAASRLYPASAQRAGAGWIASRCNRRDHASQLTGARRCRPNHRG